MQHKRIKPLEMEEKLNESVSQEPASLLQKVKAICSLVPNRQHSGIFWLIWHLAFLTIFLGVYPKLLFDMIDASISIGIL